MKRVKAKWPFHIGSILIEQGEEGRTASLSEMQKLFPNISYVPDSSFCGVVFRDLEPCMVHINQIIIIDQ